MYNLYLEKTRLHNEATKSCQLHDESTLLSTFQEFNVFSTVSHIAKHWHKIPGKSSNPRLCAKELGQEEINDLSGRNWF